MTSVQSTAGNPPLRPILELQKICKRFGAVVANDSVDLVVPRGRIVALLGENGSGKSTLMKLVFGITHPDSGVILFKGRELAGHDPRDAIAAGIGMIHQHFMLVESMAVVDNVMLGWPASGRWLRRAKMAELVREASARYGLELNPERLVSDLSFGQRQRVEIVKAILRGADLLILDEPTSNLSAPEVQSLIKIMHVLKDEGRSVIFITHKLGEVMDACDEGIVLRSGRVASRFDVAHTHRSELARLMVDRDIDEPARRAEFGNRETVLQVRGLTVADKLGQPRINDVNFELRRGEILAIAGIDGNGQTELAEALAGLRRGQSGSITLDGVDITDMGARGRLAAGIAYVPVDRAQTSLIPAMTVEDNLAIRDFSRKPFSKGAMLNRKAFRRRAQEQIAAFRIACPGPEGIAGALSGGNQQKIVLAREIGRGPRVLIAMQPTWGLDPGATRFVVDRILALRDAGAAVIYISAELEEVLMLGDRIGVLSAGQLKGVVARAHVDLTQIGMLMSGADETPERSKVMEGSLT
ncbi:ABC transporter ATP-binding protein [Pandoraea horticolens]|uniref:ABC transporter ATP-binding protein n=1 Tax=Pandoraea horticolens TaxID=2508298 RepID=A0A5E4XPT1_9BURK|nr:ABC transporter ATP-binding protein [Pandoraea horticolens]VVE38306.1 ABC transporter ATP-binding protein [Pandoraea horticolens]